MGYGEELASEIEAKYSANWDIKSYNIKRGDWTKKDGSVINVRSMTDSHIRNCINMLNRKDDEFAHMWVSRFEEELDFRRYIKAIMGGELDD